jgi:hypothetical protein
MRWLMILVVAGCWASAEAPEQAPPANTVMAAPQPHRHTATHWRGRYLCAQGPTALELTLERDGDAVRGTFAFAALPENPTVPSGAYTLTGTSATADRDEVIVTMVPGQWLDQPAGYVMVGFTARTDRERRTMRGSIDDAGCGAIEVSRVD